MLLLPIRAESCLVLLTWLRTPSLPSAFFMRRLARLSFSFVTAFFILSSVNSYAFISIVIFSCYNAGYVFSRELIFPTVRLKSWTRLKFQCPSILLTSLGWSILFSVIMTIIYPVTSLSLSWFGVMSVYTPWLPSHHIFPTLLANTFGFAATELTFAIVEIILTNTVIKPSSERHRPYISALQSQLPFARLAALYHLSLHCCGLEEHAFLFRKAIFDDVSMIDGIPRKAWSSLSSYCVAILEQFNSEMTLILSPAAAGTTFIDISLHKLL